MRAMMLHAPRTALRETDLTLPDPGPHEIRVEVEACGVCRTDLHVVDGDLTEPVLPLVPGHETVGRVAARGAAATQFALGQRVGVPWLGRTCRHCSYCSSGHENLCDAPGFTGYTLNGGFAEACLADVRYVYALPEAADPVALAPLLCAGLIGYRSLKLAGPDARRLGFYGFGAAAHILAQLAIWQGREVFAFTRPGDAQAQEFACAMGAVWAGGSDETAPVELDAALIFAPVGALVPTALRSLRKGGTVVCGGIHMSDIPAFPYADLWHERQIRSVANLTRADGEEFFPLAEQAGIRTECTPYALARANDALGDLRSGRLTGAAVLVP
jgi:propanol-preferring alcohol dehydrogenase